jgi:hypothetical protein
MSDLSRFRIGEPDGSPMRPLPVLGIKEKARVLSFDQSLSETGWVVLDTLGPTFAPEPPTLAATGMLKAKADLRGHQKTLDRALDLYWEVTDLCKAQRPTVVVFETPPVGGRMSRPESSLLAAHTIRLAAIIENPFMIMAMVSRQKAAKRWTGNPNADKKVIRAALEELAKMHDLERPQGPWNEHVVDALSLGLFYLEGKHGD